jgi:hypothetical protein
MLKAAIWAVGLAAPSPPESRLQDETVEPTRRIRFSMNMCLLAAFGAWSSRTYRMNYLFVLWGVWGLGKVCHRIGSRTSNGFEIYNDNLDSTSILKILLEFGQNGPKLKFLHLWFIPAIFSSTFVKVVIMVMFIVYRLTDIACRNLLYSKIRYHLSMLFFGVKTWYSQRRSLQGHPDEYMKWPKSPGSAERFFFSFTKGLRTAHRTMTMP